MATLRASTVADGVLLANPFIPANADSLYTLGVCL